MWIINQSPLAHAVQNVQLGFNQPNARSLANIKHLQASVSELPKESHKSKEFPKTILKAYIEPLKHCSSLQFDCLFEIQ